jgi:3-oxoacyl-(acyl-carrier-protein) synthase
MNGSRVAAVAVLTGWGEGVAALPADASEAAAGRAVIPLGRPKLDSERFRRATRECLLGVAAVDALLREAGLSRDEVMGGGTALLYVTGGAYGASNQAFVLADALRQAPPEPSPRGLALGTTVVSSRTLHFPYTAPSAMAGEVAIEFSLTGAYGILIGGPAATIDALWQATCLLAGGRCERALVLAVETFEECAALYARERWLVRRPLVEAAACALLVPGARRARYDAPRTPSALETLARARAGETLACGPLIALALAADARGEGSVSVTGEWRGRRAGLHWEAGPVT